VKESAHKLFFRRCMPFPLRCVLADESPLSAAHQSGHESNDSNTLSIDIPSPSSSTFSTGTSHQRLIAALEDLRKQHATLVRSLVPPADSAQGAASSVARSPMFSDDGSGTNSYASSPNTPTPSWRRPGHLKGSSVHWTASARASIASSAGEMWFDAPEPEGALEFVMEDPDPIPNDQGEDGSKLSVVPMMRSVSGGSHTSEAGADDSDDEQEDDESVTTPEAISEDSAPLQKHITRRTQLPSGPVGDEGSLFGVLKKNVGKVRHIIRVFVQILNHSSRIWPVSQCLYRLTSLLP
jgi:oxysterol-binding protein-related protein 3/6/7